MEIQYPLLGQIILEGRMLSILCSYQDRRLIVPWVRTHFLLNLSVFSWWTFNVVSPSCFAVEAGVCGSMSATIQNGNPSLVLVLILFCFSIWFAGQDSMPDTKNKAKVCIIFIWQSFFALPYFFFNSFELSMLYLFLTDFCAHNFQGRRFKGNKCA